MRTQLTIVNGPILHLKRLRDYFRATKVHLKNHHLPLTITIIYCINTIRHQLRLQIQRIIVAVILPLTNPMSIHRHQTIHQHQQTILHNIVNMIVHCLHDIVIHRHRQQQEMVDIGMKKHICINWDNILISDIVVIIAFW